MKYNIIFLLIPLFACQSIDISNNKPLYSSKGFAYVYNEQDYENKIIKHRFNNNKLLLAHHKLKPRTLVKVTNPENKKSLTIETSAKTTYPDFYNILITKKLADILKINLKVPYVEIQELKKNKLFVADRAKTFNEEKKIFNNAPVEKVKIDNISATYKKNKIKKKKFSIIIAQFYSESSAKLLKTRILNESPFTNKGKLQIKVINNTNIQLLSGPYNSINLLKNDYLILKTIGLEDLDIKLNE